MIKLDLGTEWIICHFKSNGNSLEWGENEMTWILEFWGLDFHENR